MYRSSDVTRKSFFQLGWGRTIEIFKHHKSFLFVSPLFKISPTVYT